jgi:hypothetical protein
MCTQRQLDKRTLRYGKEQIIPNNNNKQATEIRIKEMHEYMTETVYKNETYAKVKSECKNRNRDCANWAAIGECEKNPAFMTM